MKVCKTCFKSKDLSEYYVHKGARDGYRRSCKSCVILRQKETHDPVKAKAAKQRYYDKNREVVIERSKQWREENREEYNRLCRVNRDATRARGYALKRKYGISLEQYEELLERQNGCCAICGRHETEFKTNLAVDHSHRSGRIRGLLCTGCNYRLVAKHEDSTILRKVADYIEQGTEWFVPEKKKKKRKSIGKSKAARSASADPRHRMASDDCLRMAGVEAEHHTGED